jgi:hypothetical protein
VTGQVNVDVLRQSVKRRMLQVPVSLASLEGTSYTLGPWLDAEMAGLVSVAANVIVPVQPLKRPRRSVLKSVDLPKAMIG